MWRRGRSCASRWTLFELATMVLGFMVFWPIGRGGVRLQDVAAQVRRRRPADVRDGEVERSARRLVAAFGVELEPPARTGNAAFDQWKAAELARLEAERRKLEDAAREFAEFLDNVRHAKDREEFERFMAERRAAKPPSPLPQAGEGFPSPAGGRRWREAPDEAALTPRTPARKSYRRA